MSHAEVLVRVSSILKEFGFCPKEKCIDNIKLYCSFCIQNHNFLYANAYLVCWLFDYFFNLFWKVSLYVQDVLLWHISQRCVFIIKVTLSEFLRTSPYCFFKWTLGHRCNQGSCTNVFSACWICCREKGNCIQMLPMSFYIYSLF